MKKLFTLASFITAVAILSAGNILVQAQSSEPLIITSDSSPQYTQTTPENNCTISYQIGSDLNYQSPRFITSISPNTTISYQDPVSFSLNTDTSSYPTISVKPSSNTLYPIISLQDYESIAMTRTTLNEVEPTYNFNYCAVLTDSNNNVDSDIQYPYANITANDSQLFVYIEYDGSVTLNWESYGMDSCTVNPISESGFSGQYELQNITGTTTVTLNCEVSSEYPYLIVPPSSVQIKVLPPTFDYLKAYLSQIQPSSNKKVNLNSVSNFIDQAQKAKKTDLAQSFLQKSVDSLKRAAKGSISSAEITKYENAASYLSKTLPVKIVIDMDSCSVTATGPAGFIMQYGANEERRGFGDEVTIPESGTITASIYATSGWTATAEVIDSTGLIYARQTEDVTDDNCPFPPAVYDPTLYNGYPEKWGAPEPGTVIDDWGYYNKTAESYVAFRITDSGRTFPTGYGDASTWLDNATAEGFIIENPQVGDIAINTLDAEFGGPIAWYVDAIDELGNYQISAIRNDGNMNWSSGTVEGSTYLKYIRLP